MLFEMKLTDEPFKQIANREKTVELRLHDEKRQALQVGDEIKFTRMGSRESVTARVIALHRYPTFRDLLSTPLFEKCGCGSMSLDEAVESMYCYYTEEQERLYGVLGIELERFS